MSEIEKKPSKWFALLLAVCTMVGPFAANAYQPGFEFMGAELGISRAAVQQTLSIYLISYACGSLFIGAVSDAYGRKRVLVLGLLFFALASLAASFATSFEMLIICRILMGLGVSVGQVLALAITRDYFKGRQAQEMMASIAMIFALAPAVSPVVGGWLVEWQGWRSVFVFLTIFSTLIATIGLIFLKESLPVERRVPFSPVYLAKAYCRVLRNPAFVAGVVAHGFLFMGSILFAAGAADLVLNVMHMGVTDFGYLMFPLIGVGVVGASMSTRFVDCFGAKGAMRIHVIVMMTTAVIGMVLNYQWDLAWPWLLVPAMIYSFAMAALRPIISVYNMDYYPKNRGLAASVQQSLQTLSFATCAGVLVPLIMGHGWMYYLVLVGASLCVGGLWFVSMVLRPKYLPQED